MSLKNQDAIKKELSKLTKLINDFVNKSEVLENKDFKGMMRTGTTQTYICPDGNGGWYESEVPCE